MSSALMSHKYSPAAKVMLSGSVGRMLICGGEASLNRPRTITLYYARVRMRARGYYIASRSHAFSREEKAWLREASIIPVYVYRTLHAKTGPAKTGPAGTYLATAPYRVYTVYVHVYCCSAPSIGPSQHRISQEVECYCLNQYRRCAFIKVS